MLCGCRANVACQVASRARSDLKVLETNESGSRLSGWMSALEPMRARTGLDWYGTERIQNRQKGGKENG